MIAREQGHAAQPRERGRERGTPAREHALPAPEALLSFVGTDVGYERRPVLGGVNLAVHAGEIVGLIGPNAAGKSTLLRSVTGASEVLAGSLGVAGTPHSGLSARERARLVGVVPQTVSAAFSFSALEFVELGRNPHLARFQRPGASDRAVVERVMRVTDTWRLADALVDTLSGGDLQRLALAQALAQEPRVLLLDEPVSHLDLNHRLQVLDLVRDLADGGLGVLAVFHDLDLAARYSDRLAVVAGGHVSRADAPAEVITEPILREVFGVRAVVGRDPVMGTVNVTPVLREEAIQSAPRRGRVLLVAGSGSGAALMRTLSLGGYEVTAAALNVGDVDEGVAATLGLTRVTLPPYATMDADATARVRELVALSDAVVVCRVPFGGANAANLRAVVESGRPLVLVGEIEDRDFTGGDASDLWASAISQGARCVADESLVPGALEDLTLRPEVADA